MSTLSMRAAEDSDWDLVSLGEVMLRLDPGEGRVHTAREFRAFEGGGEYNVARGLRRCFGLRTAIVTALADNPIGRLVEDLMLQGGVDTSLVCWREYDGTGTRVRNGLNFTERGFGPRAAVGCSDRGHTAVSQLEPGELPWSTIFGERGARCLHTGGIFAALGRATPRVALEAMQAARAAGTLVSFDLNYRKSLWQSAGGERAAQAVNRELVGLVDVLFGNEEDLSAALGFEVPGSDAQYRSLDARAFVRTCESVAQAYPNLRYIATTLRTAHSATLNDWGAVCFDVASGQSFEVPQKELHLLDRVGGGDSFASGFLYGLLAGRDAPWALACGVAHGALAMSTPGDTTMASLREVLALMNGKSARIER
jgi:2-dehydro-3-deoxygluconokinase